jgi:hypothetical protein
MSLSSSHETSAGVQKALHPVIRARWLSLRAMTHGLDIVAVGIEHEGGVIVGVVVGLSPDGPLSVPPAFIAAR